MDPITSQQPSQQPPQQPQQTPPMMAPEHKKVGPIVAILVVALVLIVGALYIFASRMNQQPTDGTSDTASTQTSVQPVTNSADDVNSTEADLNTSVNGLDSQNF